MLTTLPKADPGSIWRSICLDTGATITCLSDTADFDQLRPDQFRLETATGQSLQISRSGTGFFRTVDANGNPCVLRFGKALHSPQVHNLLSAGSMIEQGAVRSIRLRRTGSYIRLRNGERLPLRYENRLFYLDYQTRSSAVSPACTHGACSLRHASAPLAGLPREAFYEAPTQPLCSVSEVTDFLPPLDASDS